MFLNSSEQFVAVFTVLRSQKSCMFMCKMNSSKIIIPIGAATGTFDESTSLELLPDRNETTQGSGLSILNATDRPVARTVHMSTHLVLGKVPGSFRTRGPRSAEGAAVCAIPSSQLYEQALY